MQPSRFGWSYRKHDTPEAGSRPQACLQAERQASFEVAVFLEMLLSAFQHPFPHIFGDALIVCQIVAFIDVNRERQSAFKVTIVNEVQHGGLDSTFFDSLGNIGISLQIP